MTTKAKALDRLIDAIAGEDVPMTSQTVAGRLDTLADTLAGDDVTFSARDIAGRISQLAGMIEDGTISIGGGGSKFKPIGDGKTHFWVNVPAIGLATVTIKIQATKTDGCVIDWGDGKTSTTSGTSRANMSHEYSEPGVYCITFTAQNDAVIKFGGGTNYAIFYDESYKNRLLYAELSATDNFGTYSFDGCKQLKQVVIDDSITALADALFNNCTSLEHVQIPTQLTSLGTRVFNGCSSLSQIDNIDNVTSIGTYAFAISGLISIDIPAGITEIPEQMLAQTAISEVDIPSGVTSIGASAFNGCAPLKSVTVRATTPPTLGTNVFYSTSSDLVIYVPAESVETYKAATNWSSYASKIQAIPA